MNLQVELFTVPGCATCGQAIAVLERALADPALAAAVSWRRVDVVAELDRAVGLGILATPAIVIGDELVFTGVPAVASLRLALQARLPGAGAGTRERGT